MQPDEIKPFLGKQIKLVQDNDFILNGTIDMIYEDSILFSNSQATSLIRTDCIKQISLKKKQY